MLEAFTADADELASFSFRGQRIVMLTEPALVGALLAGAARDTVKGPGVRLTRRLLGDGLLTSEGDSHTRARRLVAPAFSRRRLAGYVDTFAERAEHHQDQWSDGQVVDMNDAMSTLTLDAVGRTLLSVDLTDDTTGVRSVLDTSLAEFVAAGGGVAAFRRRRASAVPEGYGPQRHAMDRIVAPIVAQRREDPSLDRGDVVSALVGATDGPDGLSDTEIHDHVITLLMAGHETTANALTWTLHLLSTHPDVQRKMHNEVNAFAARRPSFDDLAKLPYTRAVITEGMRLYPPAWVVGRTVVNEIDLGRWRIPAGALVVASPLLLHRDERWFADPDTFDPDRWLDHRRELVPRYAYLPFGTGPRACIGEQFAWAEATTILAVLASRWTFSGESASRSDDPPAQYAVTLRPRGPILIRVNRR